MNKKTENVTVFMCGRNRESDVKDLSAQNDRLLKGNKALLAKNHSLNTALTTEKEINKRLESRLAESNRLYRDAGADLSRQMEESATATKRLAFLTEMIAEEQSSSNYDVSVKLACWCSENGKDYW